MLIGWTETLRDDCLNAVSDYFHGRMDNSIVSFGKTGRNVTSRLYSRLAMGTELVSVEYSLSTARRAVMSFVSKSFSGTLRRNSPHRERLKKTQMGGSVALDFITSDHRIERLDIYEKDFNDDPDRVSDRIMSTSYGSSSFILLSDFGEIVSQKMHIAFSKMLTRKGIPHLNVITLSGTSGTSENERARFGVEELKKSGGKVVTYAEEAQIAKDKDDFSGEFYQMVAKKVYDFSLKLGSAANLLKIQLMSS